ncbi:MAG: PglD-related sugar-binding protein, partial [Planctomycetota bacterium]
MEDLVIVGAGGYGREVLWLVREINEAGDTWRVVGFLDDDPAALDGVDTPVRVVSSIRSFQDWNRVRAVCAIGDPAVRRRVVDMLDEQGARWAGLYHPTSFVGTGSTVGKGCIFCRDSGVTADSSIGNHVHFNIKSTAGHDTRLGDFCTLSSHVDINGGAVLEEGV